MYGSLVRLAVGCTSLNKRKAYTAAPGRDLSPKMQLEVCVCVGAFDRHRTVHTPKHAGTHVSRQHMTLLLGPQSQHGPRLQGEAEGCPWLLRKLSGFPSYEPGNGGSNCLDTQPTFSRAQK